MTKWVRKREVKKDLTAALHVAGDELCSQRQVESSLCVQLTRPVSWWDKHTHKTCQTISLWISNVQHILLMSSEIYYAGFFIITARHPRLNSWTSWSCSRKMSFNLPAFWADSKVKPSAPGRASLTYCIFVQKIKILSDRPSTNRFLKLIRDLCDWLY